MIATERNIRNSFVTGLLSIFFLFSLSNFFFLLELSKILDCQFYFFDKLILSLKWTPLYTPGGHVLIARIKQNISDVIYYDLFVDQIPHVKNRHNNFNFLRKTRY